MSSGLKNYLRRLLLGYRFQERLQEDHRVLGRLGNQHYLELYPGLLAPGSGPEINAYEFSRFSQNGEDGIILFLASRTGVDRHYIVEIGTEDGRECNSANLILNYGWQGLLIEASKKWTEKGKMYFAEQGASNRATIINQKVTPSNVNEILYHGKAPNDLDILSIDIDSYDYWVWEAVDGYNPRIVIIEYNASFGPSRSVTIPKDALENNQNYPSYYHGASLVALKKLGERKGYDLLGCDSHGVNSFFVRKDLAKSTGFQAQEPDVAFRKHFRRSRRKTVEQQFQEIAHLPLVEID
jgi:hypothetical protein